jgi:hypothetical protein
VRVEFLKHHVSPIFGVTDKFIRDLLNIYRSTGVFGIKRQEFHIDQIDDSSERITRVRRALTDWDLHRDGIGSEARSDFLENSVEVSPFAIEFIDKDDSRNAILVGLSPHRFALGFDSLSGAKHHNSTIEDSQAAFDFSGEVDVTWGIEQVDGAVFPPERHASGEDRDTALLFFWIVIGFGSSRVDSPCAVFGTAHVEHLFGNSGFTGIDVSNDADISNRM